VRARGRRRERLPQLPSPPLADGVVIRPERDADHPVIAELVPAAFVGHPDEVASFVERIRASEQFIPELAFGRAQREKNLLQGPSGRSTTLTCSEPTSRFDP
jgi:hypothetical protein